MHQKPAKNLCDKNPNKNPPKTFAPKTCQKPLRQKPNKNP